MNHRFVPGLGLVVGALALGACTYSFPNTSTEGTFACRVDADCLSGFRCVQGFCSAGNGGGGDNGNAGGDQQGGGDTHTGDPGGPTFALSITKAGVGTGAVTSNPTGINCGATCQHDFAQNTVVTLGSLADVGSRFTGWQGACTGLGTCQVTMSANRTVTAEFMLDTARPVVNVLSGAGTVTGGSMRLDFQVGGGLEARRVGDTPSGRTMEAGPGLQPKQQR